MKRIAGSVLTFALLLMLFVPLFAVPVGAAQGDLITVSPTKATVGVGTTERVSLTIANTTDNTIEGNTNISFTAPTDGTGTTIDEKVQILNYPSYVTIRPHESFDFGFDIYAIRDADYSAIGDYEIQIKIGDDNTHVVSYNFSVARHAPTDPDDTPSEPQTSGSLILTHYSLSKNTILPGDSFTLSMDFAAVGNLSFSNGTISLNSDKFYFTGYENYAPQVRPPFRPGIADEWDWFDTSSNSSSSGSTDSGRSTYASIPFAPHVSAQVRSTLNLTAESTEMIIVTVSYTLSDGTAGTATFNIPINVGKDAASNSPTPHLVISGFNTDGNHNVLIPGNEFQFTVSFRNTSDTVDIENVMLSFTPPAGTALTNATTSFHIERVPAGGTASQTITLVSDRTVEDGSLSMTITFNYEYLKDDAYTAGTDTETAYLRFSKSGSSEVRDRFEISEVTAPTYSLTPGSEDYISISFINRGSDPIYNITGIVRCEGLSNDGAMEYFGILNANQQDEVEVMIVCGEAGTYNGTAVLQYEHEDGTVYELERPFTLVIEEMVDPGIDMYPGDTLYPDGMDPALEENSGLPWWGVLLIIVIAGAAVVIGVIAARKIVKKRKENALALEDMEEMKALFGEDNTPPSLTGSTAASQPDRTDSTSSEDSSHEDN